MRRRATTPESGASAPGTSGRPEAVGPRAPGPTTVGGGVAEPHDAVLPSSRAVGGFAAYDFPTLADSRRLMRTDVGPRLRPCAVRSSTASRCQEATLLSHA